MGLTVALSSGDTSIVATKHLPRAGRYAAVKTGVRWLPDILSKKAHRKLHGIIGAAARDLEAEKAQYTCAQLSGVRRVLVLDDLATRGTTMNNIANAILSANRGMEVYPIVLGKSEKKSYGAKFGRVLTNEHVPSTWQKAWVGS